MNYRTEKYGLVCAVKVVYDDEDVILISSEGLIIRLAVTDIRECARPSKGVRVMRLGENDKVITLTSTLKSEDEPADALPDNPEDENEQETAQDEQ
mgnify:FL=1